MKDDPLEEVHAFVEKAYFRLQAGDILLRCLEVGSPIPIQQVVEGLVLAGPDSIGIIREILVELSHRKAQLWDDANQLLTDFEASLKRYEIELPAIANALAVTTLSPSQFIAILDEQGITDDKRQGACLQIFRNSRELMASLGENIFLLNEIQSYLQDWLFGLAQLSARQLSGNTKI
jgi:hypothetical protein